MNKSVQNKLPFLKALLLKHGVVEAYIFGSAAKGQMEEDSDVDFLIQFDPKLDYVSYADNYFILLKELRSILKRDVDLVAAETVTNPYFAQSIEESKIRVL